MKKITKPTAKSSVPASKPVKSAKVVTKKPAATPVRKTAPAAKTAKSKVVKSAPVPAVPAELVPARPKPTKAPKVVKALVAEAKFESSVETRPAVTTIVAAVDVGFGNVLTLRGEGAGLSWDTGLALACTAADRWTIKLPAAATPLVFKFLINDSVWSVGENFTIAAGADAVFSPVF
ncbi:hypothetical protein EBZ70_01795 [bacterium]|jgi:hypothetical protein|nr:hypothetical protein [bacterium]